MDKKFGFTLAEVLITLAVVGVVAAMIIPTLVAKINDIVNTNQRKVVTTRLVDGLNQFNIMENGLAKSYNNTYEFLQGLSAHYKMTEICDANHLSDCVPYSTLSYDNKDTEESVSISELRSKLKFPPDFLAPAGFISADGTPFVVAFSANCGELSPDSIDPDKKMSAKDGAITPCLAGIYDLNGTKSPNKISTDITAFNGAKITIFIYNDDEIRVISYYPADSVSYFDARQGTELYAKYGISGDGQVQDHWVWGMEQCKKDGGSMPTMVQLGLMANRMYAGNLSFGAKEDKYSLQFNSDSELAKALGVDANTSAFRIWSSELDESNENNSYYRQFNSIDSHFYGNSRGSAFVSVVCLGE